MRAPLRVCHVIHSLGPGGAEAVLVDLASVAAGAGMQLDVVSLTPSGGQVHAERLKALGVPVHDLSRGGRWDPRRFASGIPTIAAARPDIVHTHLKDADLIGAAAAARLRVPTISTLHLVENEVAGVGRAKRAVAAQVRRRRAAVTIAVSVAVRRWYLGAYPAMDPARVRTLRTGLCAAGPRYEARERIRAGLGVPPTAVVVLQVGIMRAGKGHETLLRAAATSRPGVHFVLAGDGPLRPWLESQAAHLPPGRVTFTGYRSDVADLMAAADIVAHPSLFDALPTALLSALAAGRPVVASAVGGIPEIVTDGAGMLVAPGDAAALGEALEGFVRAPDSRARAGAAALRRFEAEFEAGRWARRLRLLYEEVLGCR